jgi:threonine aldolase
MSSIQSFASDNNSGMHPEVLRALSEANNGHVFSYGADPYTAKLKELIHSIFGEDTAMFPVYNGTGANVLALRAVCRSYEAVFCSNCAHIYEDECGAPEFVLGSKLIPLPHTAGKLSLDDCAHFLEWRSDEHRVQPKVISITQATEFGTCYSPEEIREISAFCKSKGMYLHMDGARIANAAAGQNLGLREATRDLGIDLLSFGATKNGLLAGELFLCFRSELTEQIPYFRKQHMQLHSKMRFLSAQFIPYLEKNLWRENALHANRMAALLREKTEGLPGIGFPYPTQANGVFMTMPKSVSDSLQKEFPFYIFDPGINLARFMCSWDTTETSVHSLAEAVVRTSA